MTLENRMILSIRKRAGNVVLRSELAGMGSASQVTRVLRVLVLKGVLFRIGLGVYAKTRKSSVTGAIVPAGSLETLATEALGKLGVAVQVGSAAAAYNRGDTSQLPGQFVVDTGSRRISRKIAVGGRTLKYEINKVEPAKKRSLAPADKSQARRDLAAVYLRDSRYGELSWRSRADAALDAVYLYALAALGAQADDYEHPDAKALTAAAQKLGLTAVEIAPAVLYLERRYDAARPLDCLRGTYEGLISIAEKISVEGAVE